MSLFSESKSGSFLLQKQTAQERLSRPPFRILVKSAFYEINFLTEAQLTLQLQRQSLVSQILYNAIRVEA